MVRSCREGHVPLIHDKHKKRDNYQRIYLSHMLEGTAGRQLVAEQEVVFCRDLTLGS